MTVQLYGRQVEDLFAASVGETERCTHFIVLVHIASGAIDRTWTARPHRDAQVFASVERNRLTGDVYRVEVRPVKNNGHWFWGTAA